MKTLAIFYGGKSSEHDISIITAIQVINNLDTKKYDIVPIYIDYNNCWQEVYNYKTIYNYAKGVKVKYFLATGFFDKYLLRKTKFGFKIYKKIDVAINCCHGLNGEDGTLAGVLQLNNIPLVGSGVLPSAIGMDKVVMKDVFKQNNLPICKYEWFFKEDYEKDKFEILNKIEQNLKYPIIVKPANLGSSIGINISKNIDDLQKNIKIALNFDEKVILEEVVPNLREINCSCLGNKKTCEVSVLEEPKNWQTFLDFDEKYLNFEKNKKVIDIKIGKGLDEKIFDYSKRIFKIFGCSGVVRIDFMLDNKNKKLFVNEINTIPGSYSSYLWKHKYSFKNLMDKLIELAEAEYLYKTAYKYTYKSNVLENYNKSNKVGLKNKISN